MAIQAVEVLKAWFETGDTPNQEQFEALIDSFHHKNEDVSIPTGKVLKINDLQVICGTINAIESLSADSFIIDNGDLTGSYDHDKETIERCIEGLVTKVNEIIAALAQHGLISQ
ncbi:MAG: hypothetical protein NTZ33_11295 [Bacteroidetes bacterium]|nr:hypothetical protein [Bacteroidota bacterium]